MNKEMIMYKFGADTVHIQFKPGVFMFEPEAAMGKTRLGKMFKQMMLKGIPVACYTYNDLKEYRVTLSDYLKGRKVKVLIIDRYNLYSDKFHDTIKNLADSGCMVLMDLKNYLSKTDVLADLDPDEQDVRVCMGERDIKLCFVAGE